MHYAEVTVVALIGYLLGTFPSAILVAKSNGIDITSRGSGNPGASNVARTLGWKRGVLVYALDALKGIVAVVIGRMVAGDAGAFWCAAAAIIGHMYPATRGFRGGKGVATGSGTMVVLQPIVSAILFAAWFGIAKTTKKASIASVVVTVGLPIGMAIRGTAAWQVAAMAGLAMLVVAKHVPNLRRLRAGTELSVDSGDQSNGRNAA